MMHDHRAFYPDFSVLEEILDAPVEESKRQLDDSDILPKCEFNRTVKKRRARNLFTASVEVELCDNVATWLLIVEIDACKGDHDHILLFCDEHRDSLENGMVTNFKCYLQDEPAFVFKVVRVERL